MTDPVLAPSFSQELEQAAARCRDEVAVCYADYAEAAREDGRFDAEAEHAKCSGCQRQKAHEALLTRAAALARAAEKALDDVNATAQGICGACQSDLWTGERKHADDCSWAALRALVLTEGSDK